MLMDGLWQITQLFLETLIIFGTAWDVLIGFAPMLLAVELPLLLIVFTGIIRWAFLQTQQPAQIPRYPSVSCICTCYSEGEGVNGTFLSVLEQTYPGQIEIIAVIDGASKNMDTFQAARRFRDRMPSKFNRKFTLLPKWQRGGRVSALNSGLSVATGEIIMALDGDTSFDNDMVGRAILHFSDPAVPAVAGSLRVRNLNRSLATRMQGLEYILSLQSGKTGLSAWNLVNNISGAFGIFRRSFLRKIGGWNTHTAEDLDLTMRIRAYATRYNNFHLPFEPHSVGHTDAPESYRELFQQRLRWDGDLLFIYLRKHWPSMTPKLMGWRAYLFILLYGILQNILMPLLVTGYTLWLFFNYPPAFVIVVNILLYFLYLILSTIMYITHLLLVSERPADDLKMAVWLPLYPLHSMLMRYWSAFAILNEIFLRTHEETGMAPWWVIRKGTRF
ncbi:MAG: glycosyltransferase family 2 protein [Methylococcales bacterium]|nr:glycosyltransferase family 2 protein [Methylococcales bacterium]